MERSKEGIQTILTKDIVTHSTALWHTAAHEERHHRMVRLSKERHEVLRKEMTVDLWSGVGILWGERAGSATHESGAQGRWSRRMIWEKRPTLTWMERHLGVTGRCQT